MAAFPTLGRPQDISDIYEQQYYVRVVFAKQTRSDSRTKVPHDHPELVLGQGDLPVALVGDHKDLHRKFNWGIVKPFYDKTFFMNGDPFGEATQHIEVNYKFKPTDKITYGNANVSTTHEPVSQSTECTPDNDGIVMYVITRYANDDYPSLLQGLATGAGMGQIVGGTLGAAPNLEIMGESEFRFKDG